MVVVPTGGAGAFDGREEGVVLRWLLRHTKELGEGAVEDNGPACGREEVVQ